MFLFIDTATTEIYTYLHTHSLHDALPICLDQATVSDPGSAIVAGVGVQPLHPCAGLRDADAVAVADHRREVADDQHGLAACRLPQERVDATVGIGSVDPLEALGDAEIGRASCRERVRQYV